MFDDDNLFNSTLLLESLSDPLSEFVQIEFLLIGTSLMITLLVLLKLLFKSDCRDELVTKVPAGIIMIFDLDNDPDPTGIFLIVGGLMVLTFL
jgi:hypothetical protein